MGRRNKRKRRNRPGPKARRIIRLPGPEARRTTPPPKSESDLNGKGKGETCAIFAEESPKTFAADAKLAGAICRNRGLPSDIAKVAYDAGRRLLSRAEIDEHGFGKVAGGLAAIAKVDIETARYQDGEAANTLNVNQQTGVRIEQPRGQEITTFQEQMASMLASILPPSVIDEHLPTDGDGQAEHDSNSSPIQEHPGT
jgi:hypothetical protein